MDHPSIFGSIVPNITFFLVGEGGSPYATTTNCYYKEKCTWLENQFSQTPSTSLSSLATQTCSKKRSKNKLWQISFLQNIHSSPIVPCPLVPCSEGSPGRTDACWWDTFLIQIYNMSYTLVTSQRGILWWSQICLCLCTAVASLTAWYMCAVSRGQISICMAPFNQNWLISDILCDNFLIKICMQMNQRIQV